MTEVQAERGLQALYQDSAVRDELTDDEAQVLLEWGETLVKALAARDLDDGLFDEALSHLTRLLTRINRFTSRRIEMSPDEQQEMLDKIIDSAQQATGTLIASAQMAAFSAQQAALDNIGSIRALAALITPAFGQTARPWTADQLSAAATPPAGQPPSTAAEMPDAAPLSKPADISLNFPWIPDDTQASDGES